VKAHSSRRTRERERERAARLYSIAIGLAAAAAVAQEDNERKSAGKVGRALGSRLVLVLVWRLYVGLWA
jgi:hypothetical protein